jgi:uncharacterized protein (TIGR00369 family)
MSLAMTIPELHDFLQAAFNDERPYEVASLDEHQLVMVLPADRVMLRPGGTVSGPTLMMLADASSYALILANLGPVALAVTSSLHINFLHKPQPGDVVATARLLKLGRKLAVCDVTLASGDEPLVAQASVTYAIPSGWGASPAADPAPTGAPPENP